MAAPKVFFVHLRRPGRDDPRTDPLYEFGSFGCTKCHCSNLFHPRHAEDLKGSRLAFVQGGADGSRLVFLTPPITVTVWADNCEACWTPAEMPFKYSEAPLLVANDGTSDFPLVKQFARAKCPSLESGLSSRLRSRSHSLPPKLAEEVVTVYERLRREKGKAAIAKKYYEALPYINRKDSNRKATHDRLVLELRAESDGEPVILNGHVRTVCRPPNLRRSQGLKKRCNTPE